MKLMQLRHTDLGTLSHTVNSVCTYIHVTRRYDLSRNLEMRGLGLANLVGAATNCYTTTGSFSCPSVNNAAGESDLEYAACFSPTRMQCCLRFSHAWFAIPCTPCLGEIDAQPPRKPAAF